MTRIYVATVVANAPAARLAMLVAHAHGHVVTYDWTQLDGDQREHAVRELDAIRVSAVVLYLEHPEACTTFSEVGAALVLGRRVIAVGADPRVEHRNFLLAHHPLVRHVADVEEAMAELEEITRPGEVTE